VQIWKLVSPENSVSEPCHNPGDLAWFGEYVGNALGLGYGLLAFIGIPLTIGIQTSSMNSSGLMGMISKLALTAI
jgi:hypothetical protein